MIELFDALFFPKKFFSGVSVPFSSSIGAFFIIYLTNYCSFLSFYPVLWRSIFSLFFFLIVFPVFLFFILFGIDLTVLGFDKNHRMKGLYGFTCCPYLFFPIAVACIKRLSLFSQVFGFLLLVLLFLWSTFLTWQSCEKKRVLFSKLLHDGLFFYVLLTM